MNCWNLLLTGLPASTLVFRQGVLFFKTIGSCPLLLNTVNDSLFHFHTIQAPDMDLQGSKWSGPCLTLSSMTSSCVALPLHSLSFCYTAVFLLKRKEPSRLLQIHCLYTFFPLDLGFAPHPHLQVFMWLASSCPLHLCSSIAFSQRDFSSHLMEMSLFYLMGAGATWAKMLRHIHFLCFFSLVRKRGWRNNKWLDWRTSQRPDNTGP